MRLHRSVVEENQPCEACDSSWRVRYQRSIAIDTEQSSDSHKRLNTHWCVTSRVFAPCDRRLVPECESCMNYSSEIDRQLQLLSPDALVTNFSRPSIPSRTNIYRKRVWSEIVVLTALFRWHTTSVLRQSEVTSQRVCSFDYIAFGVNFMIPIFWKMITLRFYRKAFRAMMKFETVSVLRRRLFRTAFSQWQHLRTLELRKRFKKSFLILFLKALCPLPIRLIRNTDEESGYLQYLLVECKCSSTYIGRT